MVEENEQDKSAEPEPICVSGEVLQAQVNELISKFSGKPERILLPMNLFNAYQLNNKFSGFTFEGDLEVYGTRDSEIEIK